MTPERKAELRARQWSVQRFDKPFTPYEAATDDVHEMLDEIDRLTELLHKIATARRGHSDGQEFTELDRLPGEIDAMWESAHADGDEIDRLQGLVREAHRGWVSVDAMGTTAGFPVTDKARCERYVEAGVRNGVRCRYGGSCHLGCPAPQDRLHWRATWDEAVADHAAHVEAILRGES